MSDFWKSRTGGKITGEEDKAFLSDFSIIPEGTKAVALIKKFCRVDKDATQWQPAETFIEITYKLIEGDYKGREVKQKIKCYEGKDTQIDRALNMLMLVMKLCDFKPTHGGEPTAEELASMQGKILGIVIGEWLIVKDDGKNLEGNNVKEVYTSEGFECETGVKAPPPPVTYSEPESAFSRDKERRADVTDDLFGDDIPF